VHGGSLTHPLHVLRDAQKVLENFQRANAIPNIDGPSDKHDKEERWTPPSMQMLKINWDVALEVHKRVVGLGILARDDKGQFKGASSVTLKVLASAPEAEALAALHAVLFAMEREYLGVVF
jgi:hypothetical protein